MFVYICEFDFLICEKNFTVNKKCKMCQMHVCIYACICEANKSKTNPAWLHTIFTKNFP